MKSALRFRAAKKTDRAPELASCGCGVHRGVYAHQSIIAGPRACAGKVTLWYFDFETAPGPLGKVGEGESGNTNRRHRANEFQVFDVFNSHHHGPDLLFRTRGDFYSELV